MKQRSVLLIIFVLAIGIGGIGTMSTMLGDNSVNLKDANNNTTTINTSNCSPTITHGNAPEIAQSTTQVTTGKNTSPAASKTKPNPSSGKIDGNNDDLTGTAYVPNGTHTMTQN